MTILRSVPFQISAWYDSEYNAYTIEGLIKYDGDRIIVEYRMIDWYDEEGNGKTAVESFHIPLKFIRSVDYKKGLFSKKLSINVNSMLVLEEILFAKHDSVTFNLKKKDVDEARHLASSVNLKISQMKLNKLDED